MTIIALNVSSDRALMASYAKHWMSDQGQDMRLRNAKTSLLVVRWHYELYVKSDYYVFYVIPRSLK